MVVDVERENEAWAPLSLCWVPSGCWELREATVRPTHVHHLPFPEPVLELHLHLHYPLPPLEPSASFGLPQTPLLPIHQLSPSWSPRPDEPSGSLSPVLSCLALYHSTPEPSPVHPDPQNGAASPGPFITIS